MPTHSYVCGECEEAEDMFIYPWDMKDKLASDFAPDCPVCHKKMRWVCNWGGAAWYDGESPNQRIHRVQDAMRKKARRKTMQEKLDIYNDKKARERHAESKKSGSGKIVTSG
jgi:predicted nucleic acid-binding Zn ribbon protein